MPPWSHCQGFSPSLVLLEPAEVPKRSPARTTTGRTSPHKCKDDPSLAVAHGCFWNYHPERAYAWELRLQDEIAADFTIDEAASDESRKCFLADSSQTAQAILQKEQARRLRKLEKADTEAQQDMPDGEESDED